LGRRAAGRMAKLKCFCGYAFSDVDSPSDAMQVVRARDAEVHGFHQWRTYQLCDIERGGALPERGTPASDAFHESLNASVTLEGALWECPRCGRLLFRRPGEETFRSFEPEEADGS
jgi:hypothetical protein